MHALLLFFNRDRTRQRKSHASKTVASIPAGLVTERTCKRQRRRQFPAPADRSVREPILDHRLKLRSIHRREALARTQDWLGSLNLRFRKTQSVATRLDRAQHRSQVSTAV